uniref:Pentatricopeptide repeat-containing protein n=1 Tax=Kalanchoe fedtschenkoi TaxID=63787 RepID=A0A7N0T7W4_KALFE
MWRSVAAKTSNFRRLLRINHNPKVSYTDPFHHFAPEKSIFQNPRVLLSHGYSTETWRLDSSHDDESIPTVTSDLFRENAGLDPAAAAASDIFGEGVDLESQHLDTAADGDSAFAEGLDSSDEMAEEADGAEEEGAPESLGDTKLQSVVSLLQNTAHVSLESALNELELELDESFVVSILGGELIPGENLLGFFNWVRKNPDFTLTSRVMEALVKSISVQMRKKDAYALWDLVKDIGEKDICLLNVEILNHLIAMMSKLGKGKAGYEVYTKFEDFGFTPNEDTYFLAIEALCRRSFFKWASSIIDKMMESGVVPDDQRIGSIISWLCKGKMAKEAHSVYLFGKEKNKRPPTAPVNFLISSLSRKDDTVKLALEMLDDLSGEARKYGIKPFTSVIRGLCRTKDVGEAKNLLTNMIEAGPPPSNGVFNLVIDAFSKLGEMDEAKTIMKLMESRGLKPDVYTYTVIMSGYAKGGQMEDAMKVLSEAKSKHAKLSHVTYHTLIRGYCKLEEFDKAVELVHEMKDYGVEANADEYNKLIQSLCLNAVDWKTAEKLLDEMNEKGLHLNGATKGLVNAVRDLEAEFLGIEETVIPAVAA